MRSEQEILDLILKFSHQHDQIRVVVLNGSRANPVVPRDPFQDYDVLCLVTDVKPFIRNPDIPPYFGEILILQTPDELGDSSAQGSGHYAYLMQFMDGNRIDLSFFSLELIDQVLPDSLTVLLLDKDNRLSPLPSPSDHDYLPKKPTATAFADCCNEFWWVCPYAAKGLWRNEPTYALSARETLLRPQLIKMLTWYFGIQTDFQKAPGKFAKYLRDGIGKDMWQSLLATYSDAQGENVWKSIFLMCDLFRLAAHHVARVFEFEYIEQEDNNVTAFLRRIRAMPPDAQSIPHP